MENHPIPQDVTGFQFKLIGQMTVKQFAYVALGIGTAYLTYLLPLQFLIKFPFVVLFGGVGLMLAFIPIEGRPMDTMILNFIKALYAPNQYVFQKIGGPIFAPLPVTPRTAAPITTTKPVDKLQLYLQSSQQAPKNELDKKELAYFNMLLPQMMAPLPQRPPTEEKKEEKKETPHVVVSPPVSSTKDFQQVITAQANQTAPAKPNAPTPSNAVGTLFDVQGAVDQTLKNMPLGHAKPMKKIIEIPTVTEKDKYTLSPAIQKPKAPILSSPVGATIPSPAPKPPTRRQLPTSHVGLPRTPDVPNLITGVVKDPRNNLLAHILVEIKDKDGNPVRAFKTNPFGQFASATPLMNGMYLIEFEDSTHTHRFDPISIEIKGQIIQPLEVFSVDAREELRKALFN